MSTPVWINLISWATKLVLVILSFLSVWSFAVIFDRRKALKKLKTQESDFLRVEAAIKSRSLSTQLQKISSDPDFFPVLRSLIEAPQHRDAVESGFSGALKVQRLRWTRGLAVLATLGANAPFIGLFGTVLGIIQSFGTLSRDPSGMNLVIASLAEALAATAIGLFVAIPAVSAYNVFQNRIRNVSIRLEAIKDLYCSKIG